MTATDATVYILLLFTHIWPRNQTYTVQEIRIIFGTACSTDAASRVHKKSTAQTSYCTYSVAHYILLSAHEKTFMVKLAEFSKKTLTTVSQSVPLKSKQFEKAERRRGAN